MMDREAFGRSVLVDLFKADSSEVYCLQTNGSEKSFDVTWYTNSGCRRVYEESRKLAETRPFEVISLDRPNFRLVTVHMYNPHVADQTVAAFLARYGEILTPVPRRLHDSLGFWNGKRQHQVLLRPDPAGFEGFVHPPALFNIGADRGYCFYSRQPPFCRRCRTHGHSEGSCGNCWRCQATDHTTKDCPLLRRCQRWGAEGPGHPPMLGQPGSGPGRGSMQTQHHHQRAMASSEEMKGRRRLPTLSLWLGLVQRWKMEVWAQQRWQRGSA